MPEFCGRSKLGRRFASAAVDIGRRFSVSGTSTDQKSSASLSSSSAMALDGGEKVNTPSNRSDEEGDGRRRNPAGSISLVF